MKFTVHLEAIDYQHATLEVEADTLSQALEKVAQFDESTLQWGVAETEKIRVVSIEDEDDVEVSYDDMPETAPIEVDGSSLSDDPAVAQSIYEDRRLRLTTPVPDNQGKRGGL